MSELSIPVASVGERPSRFRLECDAAWWSQTSGLLRDPESSLLEPFVLDLEGYALGRRLFFRGAVRGAVELACGRCLEPYRQDLSDRLELLMEPLPAARLNAEGPPEGGIVLDPEDLEIACYSGEELDFGVVLREFLQFNWPMQPRCAEGCLGLCPSCGANRNRQPCSCAGGDGTRPFAELSELLQQRRHR